MINFSIQKILKKLVINKYQIFALSLLFLTFAQANHFHPTLIDHTSSIQLNDHSDEHHLNSCVLCSVGSNQSFAIAEKKDEIVLNNLSSLYLTSDLEVFSYFNSSNSKRAPPSFV